MNYIKNSFLLTILFIGLSLSSFSQNSYKYVIIPTHFSDIGKGLNPYGVSSSLQNVFNKKDILTIFKTNNNQENYENTLTADLENTSSFFRIKVKVILNDYQNKVIWSHEGTGTSKDYYKGYEEAIKDALSELKKLPENKTYIRTVSSPKKSSFSVKKPDGMMVPSNENFKEKTSDSLKTYTGIIATEDSEKIYNPKNLYFNDTYFIDLLDNPEGGKNLIIVNGKLLGYKNHQKIATLTPAGSDGVFYVKWTTPEGNTLFGTSNIKDGTLTVTLSSGDKPVTIKLIKK